jgi:hypothetical protein
MEPVLSSLFDEVDDTPTVPAVGVPEGASSPEVARNPILDDPSSWEEDTRRVQRMTG